MGIAAASVFAQAPADVDAEAPRPKRRQKLTEPVSVHFDAKPLGEVIEHFKKETGEPLEVDWAALRELGVEQSTPVTLRLPKVPAETGIKLAMYAAISGASDRPEGVAVEIMAISLRAVAPDADRANEQ